MTRGDNYMGLHRERCFIITIRFCKHAVRRSYPSYCILLSLTGCKGKIKSILCLFQERDIELEEGDDYILDLRSKYFFSNFFELCCADGIFLTGNFGHFA